MRRVRKGTLQPLTLSLPKPSQFSKDFREVMERLHSSSYSTNRARIPMPKLVNVKMSGCTAHVLGDIWNNFNSSEAVLHKLDLLKPDVVCVAAFHPESHLHYSGKPQPTVLFPTDDDLFIRAKFQHFFGKQFHSQYVYYFDNLGIFYKANPITKICMPDDERAKLIAAGAPPLVIQEHLMGIYTVEQLRLMLETTCTEVKNRSKALSAEVPDYGYELQEKVTGIARELYLKELMSQRTLYTAAVLHKACQAFKKPALVMDDQFVAYMQEACELPSLPLYSDLYKPSKYLDSLDSLLEKLAILTYLDDDTFHRYTSHCLSPFKFLYQGQFQHESEDKVSRIFTHHLTRYKRMFEDVFESELCRLPGIYTEGRKLPRLAESVAAIETRTGSLLTHVVHETIESGQKADILMRQIEANIQEKMKAGISQIREITALQEAAKGELSPVNQEIIQRLMYEANAQLGLDKLPADFDKYKKYMKWNVKVQDLLPKDVRITAFIPPVNLESQADGYFLDPDNPPKLMTNAEQNTFTLLLSKGDPTIDFEGKSVEELKAMGGEVIAEIDGEVNSQGLQITKARESKRNLGEMLTKAGLLPSED